MIKDQADIKKMIWKYYEQLYTQKLDNLYNMQQFLKKHKLQQLTQYEIEELHNIDHICN